MAIRVTLSTILGERRWKQIKLSRATGIRPTTIGELYNDIAERVTLDHLDLICEALECDIADILEYKKGKEKRVKFTASEDPAQSK